MKCNGVGQAGIAYRDKCMSLARMRYKALKRNTTVSKIDKSIPVGATVTGCRAGMISQYRSR